MGAMLDLFKVLYEPEAVFQRVREKPAFLMPFIGLSVVGILTGIVNLPFIKMAMQAQMQASQAPAGGADPSQFAAVGLAFYPIGIAIALVIGGFLLWVLVSLTGGDAKFKTLISVAAYAGVPSIVLLSIVGTIILQIQGGAGITSQQDLQPAVGLDLLAPGTKGFLGAVLKGINPFSIWGMVLTAIGVSVTHSMPKSSGYIVAGVSFLIGVLIAGAFGAMFGR